MKTLFLILLFLVVLTGCYNEPQQVDQTSNVDIKLALLFEKDGCKIYRFFDGGRAVYWTNCKGRTEYSYNQKSGNTNTRIDVQNEITK